MTSLGLTYPKSTPSLPILTPYPPFNWGYPTNPNKDPFSPQTPTALQMPLREAQGFSSKHSYMQGGGQTFIYQPFTIADLLNWKNHTPSFTEKLQALIDLMQSIIQTHKPT
jgi:hypothetical protein